MHIHFVCSGNSYRSRLAEAYLKSKLSDKEIAVSSSGTEAEKHKFGNGPICWYAMRLMKRKKLISYMSWKERQTSKEILKDVDLLICMRQSHLDFCQNELGYIGKFEVWEIPDLNEVDGFVSSVDPGIETDVIHIKLTEETYELITEKVNNLVLNTNI
jgi:protein-tyrosine-phosphatase